MFSFADESGDLGNPDIEGSSSHFVVVMVIVSNEEDVKRIAAAIQRFQKTHRIHKSEMKFYQSKETLCIQFLKMISQFSFRVKVMIIDKRKVAQLATHQHIHVAELLARHALYLQNIRLRIDGTLSKKYEAKARKALRQVNRKMPRTIKNIKFVDSKTDELIQLADMIAGAIFRSTQSDKKDQYTYIKLIKDKIDDIYYKTN